MEKMSNVEDKMQKKEIKTRALEGIIGDVRNSENTKENKFN